MLVLPGTEDHGLRTVVITNGIDIADDVFDVAQRYAAEFKFSIHRPNPENDQILRVRSFDRIVRNMANCRSGNIPFAVNTVVTAETVPLMSDMVDFAITHGARKISFIPVVPRGRAARSPRDRIGADGLDQVHDRVAALARDDRIVVHCIDIRKRDYWIVENDGSLWIEKSRESLDIRISSFDELVANQYHVA